MPMLATALTPPASVSGSQNFDDPAGEIETVFHQLHIGLQDAKSSPRGGDHLGVATSR